MSRTSPPAALLAPAAALAVALSPQKGAALFVGLAFALACLVALTLASDRLRTAEAPWSGWLAGVTVAEAIVRLAGGPVEGSAWWPLVLLACAGAAVKLPFREAAAVTCAALGLGLLSILLWTPPPAAWRELVEHGLLLGALCGGLSFLVARERLEREDLVGDLRALTDVGSAITTEGEPNASPAEDSAPVAPEDPTKSLERLLEITRLALRARSCVLFERTVDPPAWRVAAAASLAPDFDGLATAPLGHGLVAWAAKHGVPFRIAEPGPQLRSVPYYSGDSEVASFVAVPLDGGPSGRPHGEEVAGAWAVLACDSPIPRTFDSDSEELLQLHAAELTERIGQSRTVARLRHERQSTAGLPEAVARVLSSEGLASSARRILDEALELGGARAGALLFDDATPDGGSTNTRSGSGSTGPQGERGPLLLASIGLAVPPGYRLEADEETWATWCTRHPDKPVRLPAFGPDRGMPRIARGDGLDAAWSFAAWPLGAAGRVTGALALAWPERDLPGPALLEAAGVLAGVAGATLRREEAEKRLAAGREVDGLTGLPGRSALLLRGPELASEAIDTGGRLSIAKFDLDGSRYILEEDGPQAWDDAIESLARVLRATLPATAELFRWGADEFCALLPAGEEGILVAARRASAASRQGGVADRPVTLSAGVATLAAKSDESFGSLLERVEAALSVAREFGDGKVVDAQPFTP